MAAAGLYSNMKMRLEQEEFNAVVLPHSLRHFFDIAP